MNTHENEGHGEDHTEDRSPHRAGQRPNEILVGVKQNWQSRGENVDDEVNGRCVLQDQRFVVDDGLDADSKVDRFVDNLSETCQWRIPKYAIFILEAQFSVSHGNIMS